MFYGETAAHKFYCSEHFTTLIYGLSMKQMRLDPLIRYWGEYKDGTIVVVAIRDGVDWAPRVCSQEDLVEFGFAKIAAVRI
jgi:hypothetical protein